MSVVELLVRVVVSLVILSLRLSQKVQKPTKLSQMSGCKQPLAVTEIEIADKASD